MRAPPLTTYATFTLLILRELQLERGVHAAQMAEILGIGIVDWRRIEQGSVPLGLATLARLGAGFGFLPSQMLRLAEDYVDMFRRAGWAVIEVQLDPREDDLLSAAVEYRKACDIEEPGSGFLGPRSILDVPWSGYDGRLVTPSPFKHALESRSRLEPAGS